MHNYQLQFEIQYDHVKISYRSRNIDFYHISMLSIAFMHISLALVQCIEHSWMSHSIMSEGTFKMSQHKIAMILINEKKNEIKK